MNTHDKSIGYSCVLIALFVFAYIIASFIDGSSRLNTCACVDCETEATVTAEVTEVEFDDN